MYVFKQDPPRRFDFGPLDRIIIRSREYRWVSSDEFGYVLTPALGIGQPIPDGFSHKELDELARTVSRRAIS
ncbi:hypothetical protein QA639_28815 [Bradyrhizobium pachyrhizi]|uniref:hypothetical protein n=1 Tax=Bradyrhizobium pachyrhizi TaxID=280333 RepID=UPI0024B0D7EE|nr:hypothetical protein [Bradyrhizobium pachyrhizi]WFU53643.1 hypothetical protein QA639_28815 [Bradyrhizobium pachyrhizi]